MINLVGLILPPLIDLINKEFISNKVRFWVAFGVCAIFGIFITYLQTGFLGFKSGAELFEALSVNITSVFAYSQISYVGKYEDSKLQEKVRGDAMSWK